MPNGNVVWTDRMVKVFHSWILQNYRMEYADLVAQVGSVKAEEISNFWLANVYPTVPELVPGYDPDLEPTPAEKKRAIKAQELYKQQASSHIRMLDMYLIAREKAGEMTGERAEEVMATTAKLIKQGTSLQRLPFYGEVSSQPWKFDEAKMPRVPGEVVLPEGELSAIAARAGEPEFGRIMAEMEVPEVSRPWTQWFLSRYGVELAKSGFGAFDVAGELRGWAEELQKAYRLKESAKEQRDVAERQYQEQRERTAGAFPKAGKTVGAAGELLKSRAKVKKRVKTYRELLAVSPKERAETSWAEYLRGRVPELQQEYAGLYPWGMGGRPSAFAPRIRTISP